MTLRCRQRNKLQRFLLSKKSIILPQMGVKIFSLIIVFFLLAQYLVAVDIVSIYDIQFTTNSGFDGTFPSTFVNQTVTIQGVVTAIGYENNRVFLSEPQGGAWSGIAVDNIRGRVSIGDLIQIQGRVSELMGMTVITQPQNLRVISRNNTLPTPSLVTIQEALTMEAYESVLVKITNVSCRRILNGSFLALIEDDNVGINIGNGFSHSINRDLFTVGANYSYIIGIVSFSHNRFSLHPRNIDDVGGEVARGIQSSSWGRIKSMYR